MSKDKELNKKLYQYVIIGNNIDIPGLIKDGADVNASINGDPIIFYVLKNEKSTEIKIETLEILIAKEVKLDVVDKYGNSPLCFSMDNDISEGFKIVKMLVEAGASIDQKIKISGPGKELHNNPIEISAMGKAVASINLELVNYFISKGASLDIVYSNNGNKVSLLQAVQSLEMKALKFYNDQKKITQLIEDKLQQNSSNNDKNIFDKVINENKEEDQNLVGEDQNLEATES